MFDVRVTSRLEAGSLVFEIQVRDEEGNDITDLLRFYTRFEETDIGNPDRLDVTIRKRKQ
ncbi:hypothetical protein BG58_11105 [Caballeronia jiangsuensis]|nr:hypothetical protein BG58_11105 [Caballeronia jiangsuensis]